MRKHRARLFDGENRRADRIRSVGHQRDPGLSGVEIVRKRALDEAFQRRRHIGDRQHFGHGESAIHRVDRTQQWIGDGLRAPGRALRKPGIDHFQMSRNFGLQDFQQNRVDREQRAFVPVPGFGNGHFRPRGLHLRHASHERVVRVFAIATGFRRVGHRGMAISDVFAGSHPVGRGLDSFQVGEYLLALQRGTQQRQVLQCQLHDGNHFRAGGTASIQHAVERALDFPAEFAQGLCADQATAAFERVEHTADGTQQFGVGRILAPGRQELRKVLDLFLEFLEEHFTDLVVDLFAAGAVETRDHVADHAGKDRVGHDACGNRVECRHCRRRFEIHFGRHGRRRPHRFRCRWRRGGHDRRWRLGKRRRRGSRGSRTVLRRQGPVTERGQALPGHFQDLVAIRAAIPKGFEEVFQTGQGIGEAIHLLAAGHVLATQQFVVGELAHAHQVVGR